MDQQTRSIGRDTQLTFACSKSATERLEEGVKYVQSYQRKHQNNVIDVTRI